jgi:hypothetical protein
MTKKTPTLWGIAVDIHEIGDDGHREITVGPSLSREPEGHRFTRTEVVASHRWTAGIVARIGLVLRDDLDETARQCDCTPGWPDSCAMNLSMIVDPARGEPEGPEFHLIIPTAQRAAWLAKVKHTLRLVLEADQWQPTAADERTWRNRQTNASQHVNAPIPLLDSSQETR